jgi:hypothetical protein
MNPEEFKNSKKGKPEERLFFHVDSNLLVRMLLTLFGDSKIDYISIGQSENLVDLGYDGYLVGYVTNLNDVAMATESERPDARFVTVRVDPICILGVIELLSNSKEVKDIYVVQENDVLLVKFTLNYNDNKLG